MYLLARMPDSLYKGYIHSGDKIMTPQEMDNIQRKWFNDSRTPTHSPAIFEAARQYAYQNPSWAFALTSPVMDDYLSAVKTCNETARSLGITEAWAQEMFLNEAADIACRTDFLTRDECLCQQCRDTDFGRVLKATLPAGHRLI